MVAKAKSKAKTPAASETSESIAEQTAAFLKSGGQIEEVANGVSGQTSLSGPRHITLGNKPRA